MFPTVVGDYGPHRIVGLGHQIHALGKRLLRFVVCNLSDSPAFVVDHPRYEGAMVIRLSENFLPFADNAGIRALVKGMRGRKFAPYEQAHYVRVIQKLVRFHKLMQPSAVKARFFDQADIP